MWALLLAGMVLPGCFWLQPGYGPQRTRFNPQPGGLTAGNVASLAQRWSVDLESTSISEPLIADGRVLLRTTGSNSAHVRALSLSSGAQEWQRQVAAYGDNLASSVSISGDTVWLSHRDDTVVPCPMRMTGLDRETGDVVVSEPVNYPVSGPVTAGPIAAYTVSTGCLQQDAPATLVVRDVDSLATLWTAALPGPAGQPTISDGTIYVTSADQVHAFAADGCGAATTCDPLWSREGGRGSVVDDGRMFAVSTQTVDLGHGVVAQGSVLTVYDATTGESVWSTGYWGGDPYAGLGRGQIIGLAVAHGTVYVAAWRDPATGGPVVATLDAFPTEGCGQPTCGAAWTGALPTAPRSSVIVGGDVVYAGIVPGASDDGSVVAFDAGGCGSPACSPLATVPVPGWPNNLSVAQGTLLVTSSGGSASQVLTAFRASP